MALLDDFRIQLIRRSFMNRIGATVLGLAFAVSFGHAQAAPPAAAQSAPAAVGHGAFPVKVTKTLDSSKLKEGDAVEVETAGSFKLPDGTLVPKGSKLSGHVTAAKARSKGDSESQLTVTFDKLDVSNGKRLSIKGALQAVFPPAEEQEPMMAGKASGAAGGGYSAGSAGGGYGAGTMGTVTDAKSGSDTQAVSKSEPAADPKSVGAHGIRDMSLEDGVLRSTGKQVKLGNGVRMIVHVDIVE
jgi:hypothetical protein